MSHTGTSATRVHADTISPALIVIEVEHAFTGAAQRLVLSADELGGHSVRAVQRASGALDLLVEGVAPVSADRFEFHLASEGSHDTSLRFTMRAGRRVFVHSYAWAPDSFTFPLPG